MVFDKNVLKTDGEININLAIREIL